MILFLFLWPARLSDPLLLTTLNDDDDDAW